jgi:hypothetical protein
MLIIRDTITNDAVLGKLLVDGNVVCDTLENKDTLIPCGTYKLSVCDSPKFKRQLALVYNDEVPASRGIRIHAGNRAESSRGCILVGFGRVNDTITHSKAAESAVTALAGTDKALFITGNGLI